MLELSGGYAVATLKQSCDLVTATLELSCI